MPRLDLGHSGQCWNINLLTVAGAVLAFHQLPDYPDLYTIGHRQR